ncbi:hypothetical protein [Deinococcus peraridilitoris]|nr:hypothetical protein [Deinococcus peraridilitoris]
MPENQRPAKMVLQDEVSEGQINMGQINMGWRSERKKRANR